MPRAVPSLHMRMIRILFISIVCLVAGSACTLPSAETEETDEAPIISNPEVLIVAPLANAVYREGVSVNIQAAVNNAVDIARVDVLIDDVLIVSIPPPAFQENDVFTVTQTWPAEGVGSHTVGVTAFRADGTTSDPVFVSISVVGDGEESGNVQSTTATVDAAPTLTPIVAATQAPEETTVVGTDVPDTPIPTQVVPSMEPTSDVPTASFASNINVRRGPGTEFQPPIGSFLSGQSTRILATNLAGDWLKVEYNGGEGWVYADLTTTSGNLDTLSREVGPPTPIPPTAVPTAIPTNTPMPEAQVNLVVEGHFVNPPVPDCGQNFTVGMSIRNTGDATTQTGLALIRDVHKASGDVQTSSAGGLVSVTLDPGTVHYVEVQFNVSTYVNEVHRIEFIDDVNNEIRETNENDNMQAVEFTLPANCN